MQKSDAVEDREQPEVLAERFFSEAADLDAAGRAEEALDLYLRPSIATALLRAPSSSGPTACTMPRRSCARRAATTTPSNMASRPWSFSQRSLAARTSR